MMTTEEPFTLTPANRPDIEKWCIAQGLDPDRIRGARDSTLTKAYTSPVFLRSLLTRGDYCPAAAKREPPAPVPTMEPPPDLATLLAQAIQATGVSEQRVIELIHQHVPAIMRAAFGKEN